MGLNPCFSGTYSQSLQLRLLEKAGVLILVLVEHTLRAKIRISEEEPKAVLILVLVEHTLRAPFNKNEEWLNIMS